MLNITQLLSLILISSSHRKCGSDYRCLEFKTGELIHVDSSICLQRFPLKCFTNTSCIGLLVVFEADPSLWNGSFCRVHCPSPYLLERKYSDGGVYGASYAASSVSQFSNISPIIIHEKHMSVLRKDKSFILMKYVTLQDETLKIGIQSVVTFDI